MHAQDKGVMRDAARPSSACRARATRWSPSVADVEAFGFPCVLKTTRGGYDGKGVWFVARPPTCAEPFAAAAATGVRLLAEELVDFRRELSALVARSPERPGRGVPRRRVDPARRHLPRGGRPGARPRPRRSPAQAQEIALRIAGELDVTGILAVELFETTDGRVLVNELAMRPHNTGHWTQDGAVTSQFENHLRAVLDLPLGSPAPRAPLDGDGQHPRRPRPTPVGRLYDGYPHALARDPRLRVHLYGKEPAARPQGRARQRLRRRPRGLPGAGPARRRVVPRRPGRRERVSMTDAARASAS